MAAKDVLQLDVNFPGVIPKEINKFLCTEIIKQLLYQRDQIPLPLDQLKFTVENPLTGRQKIGFVPRRASRVTQDSVVTSQPTVIQGGGVKSQVVNAYENYVSLLQHLSDAFSLAEINEMVVLLGPTVVSSRESYHITWTRDVCLEHEFPNLSARKCMGLLFKEMITNSCLWSTKHISLTNTTVLLKLNSLSENVEFLEPMLTFNPFRPVPKQVMINLNMQCPECTSESLLVNKEVLGGEGHSKHLPVMSLNKESDLIWVKVKPTVKGLKETAFKK